MNMIRSCLPLLLLSACASPPYPAYAIEDDAEQIASVVVADGALQDVVRVGRARVDRKAADGQLRVVVPVRNIDDEQIQILAQMSFRDAQQAPLGDTTNRQVITVPAGTTLDLEFVSRSREAVDYVLRLSWNK
ncbi:MAG: hypothetical protein FJ265_02570 [Planctomycetes bacterium]|nr:hypothetical protein [Planctomycetota bacterium]